MDGVSSSDQPDLVVVLVDGLRDGAGSLGTAASAFRQGLALRRRQGFEAAYTQSVAPDVALGALLTGRYPSAIPLCGRPQFAGGEEGAPWCVALPESVRTLPEVLGLYGYQSAFVSTLAPEDGSLLRGFGSTEAPAGGEVGLFPAVYSTAAAWWAANEGAPRLLVVEAPLPLSSLNPLIRQTPYGAWALAFGRDRNDPIPNTDPRRYKEAYGGEGASWSAVDAGYDGLGAAAGRDVAAFLGTLPQAPHRGRWVVTTSLRGVSLGEQSGTENAEQLVPGEATLLLERTTHVLLDIYPPDGDERLDVHPVQLVDLAPTLTVLGRAVLPAGVAGHDLFGAPPAAPVAYTEFGDMLQLRLDDDVVNFRAERHGTSSLSQALTASLLDPQYTKRPGAYRLSRVTTDPLQAEDLARVDPTRLATLRTALVAVRQGLGAPPPDALTPEREQQLEVLRANGYW